MQLEFKDGDSQVALIGDLTFNDHGAFREMLKRLLQAKDRRMVLDLSRLNFVDSAGLGMLLIARDEAEKGKRSLLLARPQQQVDRMFAVTKFDKLFAIEK